MLIKPFQHWGGVEHKSDNSFSVLGDILSHSEFISESKKHKTLKQVQSDKKFNKFKKTAFTLSEVLITLVVIGIVAAITVPTLSNYTQDMQFKSALKKNFSNISNAFNLAYGYDYNDFRDWDFERNTMFISTVYDTAKKYLYVAHECKHAKGCFVKPKAKNGQDAQFSSDYGFSNSEPYNLILNDGTAVSFDYWEAVNVKNVMGVEDGLLNPSANLVIGIDVNGPKKPNVTGRDVFAFVLTEKGLVPAGANNKSKNCTSKSVNYNYDCTAKFLKEGK